MIKFWVINGGFKGKFIGSHRIACSGRQFLFVSSEFLSSYKCFVTVFEMRQSMIR